MVQPNEREIINLMIDHEMSEALAVRAAGMQTEEIDEMIQYLKKTDTTDQTEIKRMMNKISGFPEETKWLDGDGNEIE